MASDSSTSDSFALNGSTLLVDPESHVSEPGPIRAPVQPCNLKATGLSRAQLTDLLLKHVFVCSGRTGQDLSQQLGLPPIIVDDLLRPLLDEVAIQVESGIRSRPDCRYRLTHRGRERARAAINACGYVGPAPVTLPDYLRQCRMQVVRRIKITREDLLHCFDDVVVDEKRLRQIATALGGSGAVLIHSAPGNGKSLLASRVGQFVAEFGGTIHVPYAVAIDRQVITIFDPTIHQTMTPDSMSSSSGNERGWQNVEDTGYDSRWREVRRPVVKITVDQVGRDSERFGKSQRSPLPVPLHLRANGGVLLLDDLGRGEDSSTRTLNRWIEPLERQSDRLTLLSGRSIAFPADAFLVLCTHREPRDLLEDSLLRRIRCCIRLDHPDRAHYTALFEAECRKQGIRMNRADIEGLYDRLYDEKKPPRASDPRDLLEMVQSRCRFEGRPVAITQTLLAETAGGCL